MATEFVGCAFERGLTVSIPKTKAMAGNGSQLTSDDVLPSGISVDIVPKFRYLGGLVSGDGALDREILSRISKASPAFSCLQGSILMSCPVYSCKATHLSILCVVHLAIRIRNGSSVNFVVWSCFIVHVFTACWKYLVLCSGMSVSHLQHWPKSWLAA